MVLNDNRYNYDHLTPILDHWGGDLGGGAVGPGCLSGLLSLFILFIDILSIGLNEVDSDPPMLHNREIRHLFWADDLVLFSRSSTGLQALLTKLNDMCQYWGIEINTSKTKILVFKKRFKLDAHESWFLGDRNIEVIRHMKYLGLNWSCNHTWSFHRKKIITKCHQALFSLSRFALINNNLPASTYIRLYQAMIQPIALYASEIWGIRFGGRKPLVLSSGSINWFADLDKPANRFYKQILGIGTSAPNSAVFLDLGVTRTHVLVLERAMGFWLRMLRKPETSLITECLNHQITMIENGKKPWLFSIKQILDRTGFGFLFYNPPLLDPTFKTVFSQRVRDIAFSDLMSEAHGLSSLRYFMNNVFQNSRMPSKYLTLPKKQRRLIAMIRFNMKYCLPFDPHDCCKFCNSLPIESNERWNHLIYDCPTLPPLDRSTLRIPYPQCFFILEKELFALHYQLRIMKRIIGERV